MKRIDCCGMTCPKPVLAAKEAVERYPDRLIEVRVDNEASRENVARFFKSQGWEISVNEVGEGVWTVTGAPPTCEMGMEDLDGTSGSGAKERTSSKGQKILVFIPSNRMGRGDDELGARLMANFISTLKDNTHMYLVLVIFLMGWKCPTKFPVINNVMTVLFTHWYCDATVCFTHTRSPVFRYMVSAKSDSVTPYSVNNSIIISG
jgi:TusA-related sulfurtransferase